MGWSDNGDGGKCFLYLELGSTKIITRNIADFDFFDILTLNNIITSERIDCYTQVHIGN